MSHQHSVQIYYEDTDLSGVVYHANYLRYFERAREHLLGVPELVRLWTEDGIGFVVYKCSMSFKEGAVLGDTLEIRTTPVQESDYRIQFRQDAYRIAPTSTSPTLLVEGIVELVCVDREKSLCRLPASVVDQLPTDARH